MRKKILAMLLTAAMAVSLLLPLTACGGTNETPGPDGSETPKQSDTAATSETPAVTETPEPAQTPEPSQTPEPVIPYAETNGLSFSKEKSYTIPAFTCLADPSSGEPASFDGLSITGVVDASYTIGDISVSEADADGTVQMIIPCHVEFTTTVTADAFYGEFNYLWSCVSAGLFDYYTGTVIPTDGTLHGDSVLENSIDITYQDVTYHIVYTRGGTGDDRYSDWVNVGGNVDKLQITISRDYTYTMYMPKEYDGLCLGLYLPGQTELPEDKEDSSEIGYLLEVIEEAGEDINDYALIRVSDLM